MNWQNRRATGIALAAGVLGVGCDAMQSRTSIDVASLGPQVGEEVPAFSLPDQNGQVQTLESTDSRFKGPWPSAARAPIERRRPENVPCEAVSRPRCARTVRPCKDGPSGCVYGQEMPNGSDPVSGTASGWPVGL